MLRRRVIPVLLLRDGGVWKSVRFEKHKYVGDPINAVRIFNEKGVDELSVIDIGRGGSKEPDFDILKRIAREAFMPLSYGGGISSVEQARAIVRSGYEKIILNSAFLLNPELVRKCSQSIGSSSTTVCIDYKKNLLGKRLVHSHQSLRMQWKDPLEAAQAAECLGAGEIIFQSVDLDGTMQGYDVEYLASASSKLGIPTVCLGGAGTNADLMAAAKGTACQGLAAGSMFVFHGPHKAVLISYPDAKTLEDFHHLA